MSDDFQPVIGVIGGIGSGKSHAARELARHGGHLIIADHLGHEALLQPELKEQLVRRWGAGILKEPGDIDRKKVGAIVFGDEAELRALEAVVFPFIGQRIVEEITKARSTPACRFVVLDAAVLLEAGWNKVCDWIVYVDVPLAQRLERVARQRGWSESEVHQRESLQWPLDVKKAQATFVLDNSGTLEQLAQRIQELLRNLTPTPSLQGRGVQAPLSL